MRTHGIQGAKRRGKLWRTTITNPTAHRARDLVQRDFTASRPDELWVADLVADALAMALTRRQEGADVQLIHHSDAGSQYTSQAFQQVLDDHYVLGSIGTVSDAYDNAMAESFVDTFKTELIRDRV